MAACQHLTATMEWNPIGFHFWPWIQNADWQPEGPSECGICTNGARILARQFNGYVAGYWIEKFDSPSLIGYDGGHDFAVIGSYIVDWWAWNYEQSIECPVLHGGEDRELIAVKYKTPRHWVMYPRNDFRKHTLSGFVLDTPLTMAP